MYKFASNEWRAIIYVRSKEWHEQVTNEGLLSMLEAMPEKK
jgi:hypothetical protein